MHTRINWNIRNQNASLIANTRKTWRAERQQQNKNKNIETHRTRPSAREQQGENCKSARNHGGPTTWRKNRANHDQETAKTTRKIPKRPTNAWNRTTGARRMGELDDEVYKRQTHARTQSKIPNTRTWTKDAWGAIPEPRRKQIHQKLKPHCAENMSQEDQNNKSCPSKNCNFRHQDPRRLQSHLFYQRREKTFYTNSIARTPM